MIHEAEIHIGRKNLRTIGRCIYCGKDGSATKLTEEHIIPFSLGADQYLKDASCLACADITKKFELHVARNIFGHHRIHQNIQTRHPKDRPNELRTRVIKDGIENAYDLPIEDHPYFLPIPVWDRPGIIRNVPPSKEFSGLASHLYNHIPENIRETLGLADGDTAEIRPPDVIVDTEQFARAIAKIAYCQAIARFGFDGFRRLALPDLILGKYSCIPYFVGSVVDELPPPPQPAGPMHVIETVDVWVDGKRLLIAVIRLFAKNGTKEHGMPIYTVVVGAPLCQKSKQ